MGNVTIYKRDIDFKLFKLSILNYDTPRFTWAKLPKRFVIDILYWQFWLEK